MDMLHKFVWQDGSAGAGLLVPWHSVLLYLTDEVDSGIPNGFQQYLSTVCFARTNACLAWYGMRAGCPDHGVGLPRQYQLR
eukprot:1136160-Pelagomonas_calceolata.AAC.3